MIHQFDHRWATYEASGGDDEDACRNVTVMEKRSADFVVRPRYWVRQREVLARLADVPAAVAKAYVGDAEPVLRKAVANWLALAFVGQYPLATPRDIVAKMVGKPFAEALPKEWLDEKFKVGTSAPPSADELNMIRNSSDLFCTFDAIMDRRSPRWLMGWRDITNATNERTVIASVIARAAVGNKMPLINLPVKARGKDAACFLGNLDCLVLDFVARQKIGGTTLNFFYVRQFPILKPSSYSELDACYIVPRVLELTYTSHDLKPWAEDLGYTGEPFVFDEERRAVLRAELDAYYAKLYGLNEEELRYILDPADVAGADYPSETFRVLKDREIREYGEYRTKNKVLEAWKRLESEPEIEIAASTKTVRLRTKLSQAFPSDGVETFIFELFPQVVAQYPGQTLGFYKEAAVLALMPDARSRLVPGVSTGTNYLPDGEWRVRWTEVVNTLVGRKVVALTREGTVLTGEGQIKVRHYDIDAALIAQTVAGAKRLADASAGAGMAGGVDVEVVRIAEEIQRRVA